MNALPACMSVYSVQAWFPQRAEEKIKCPGTGITIGCKSPHGCQELNSGPLREQMSVLSS